MPKRLMMAPPTMQTHHDWKTRFQPDTKSAPFQTQLVKEATPAAEIASLLPAAFLNGPGSIHGDIAIPSPDDAVFLETELGLGRLANLEKWLWLAGRPLPPRPLHYQRVLRRDIVVVEQMDLHLVWTTGQIYIKPVPRCLLETSFWSSSHILAGDAHDAAHPRLRRCALGFLYSYASLVRHESDFQLAQELRLLPSEARWADWRRFVAELLRDGRIYDRIDPRFHYGELRLSRLNKMQYLRAGAAYLPPWDRYNGFIHDNFAWLAATTVYIAVVLTAMQVGLATDDLVDNQAFQSASYGFTIFSILGPLIAAFLILAVLLGAFAVNWMRTLSFRDRRMEYIARASGGSRG